MKKILGLDLGTTSIGWAFVTEGETAEQSKIERLGVRIIQYDTFSKVDKTGKISESKDPVSDFNAGRGLSPNADRTAKRGARRNLDRYQLRRANLIEILRNNNIIGTDFIYAEDSKNSTFSTYKLRADAASKEIPLSDFAKILLMINKKRGYKSSRKAKSEDEGTAIDGMAIAKELYETNQTPGQYVLSLIKKGKNHFPDFYKSDLENEYNSIWDFQKKYHPEILSDETRKQLSGKGLKATKDLFYAKFKLDTAQNKGADKRLKAYEWRAKALNEQLTEDILAYVIAEIRNNLNSSSGYLGAISDRSKELYFNKKTVGQYLYEQLANNKHARLKSQVFYRQDYMDEFEKIWSIQSKYHAILTENLKNEIRDVVIFYQRKLKSQKHLISNCEFEKYHKAIPKSSPLFQEYKIWSILNNLEFTDRKTKEKLTLELETKNLIFNELNIKGRLNKREILELLGHKEKDYDLNFKEIEGNNTNKALFEAYKIILEREGYDLDLNQPGLEIMLKVKTLLNEAKIDTGILDFDSEKECNAFDKQKSYQFWHALHSIEEDLPLLKTLESKYGFSEEYAKIIANLSLQPDYGSLSAKAIKKILPFLKAGNKYSDACAFAKYNHSSSKTKEEIDARIIDKNGLLDLLSNNSLRNPVVEKILNQMVHVVNAVIKDPALGKPDEIRIELARELKKSNKEREEMTLSIAKSTGENEIIRKKIKEDPFNIKNPTRNDIIKYKLYEELASNGHKTLYSGTYISPKDLFSKNFDVEHIIPKAKLFDDSFSNKTIELSDVNRKKGDMTALDFVAQKYESKLEDYAANIERLFKEGKLTKAKYKKLLMSEKDIPADFLARDLRDTQYIAKKAKEILETQIRVVASTTGNVTDRLREDWGLINIMQELNFEKYKSLGLIEKVEKKDGSFKEKIVDWSKRNDHRHHAMDALTVAFTKPAYIQYLNNINARKQETKLGKEIAGIEAKYLKRENTEGGSKKVFNLPIPNFRTAAKVHLESILISFKAKNKVVTKNKNKIKQKGKDNYIVKTQLTPRGQLHKETIYGKIKTIEVSEVKIDGKFNLEKIATICNPTFRALVLSRLNKFDNDPKLAFSGKNSLDKNPIWIDEAKSEKLPEKIKTSHFEDDYTIRKDVSPDLKIDKVIDQGIKRILEARLIEYKNDPKKAFVELDKNPIWLNKDKGIAIKKVRITGVKNAEALHTKKDHLGKKLLTIDGKKQAVDFVSTGNNHHVAIYKDADGNLQEEVVSLYEAVARANAGLPIIDKNHVESYEFLFTMKQNEYFVFSDENFNPREIDLLDPKNYTEISKRLFRVQKLSVVKYGNSTIRDFMFRHHLETTVEEKNEMNNIAYIQIKSLNPLLNMVKVRINHLGIISQIGEY
jgi:CRISPR-associated endonuclease Csn1